MTNDKIVLTADKEKLISDLVSTTIIKQDLEEKVNISSTLNASNITVTPINIKIMERRRYQPYKKELILK